MLRTGAPDAIARCAQTHGTAERGSPRLVPTPAIAPDRAPVASHTSPTIGNPSVTGQLRTTPASCLQSSGIARKAQCPEAFNATLSHGRWPCRPTAAHRTHHLHLVDEPTELDRHLRFRGRLGASPSLRDKYARLKRELAERRGTRRACAAGR